MTYYPINQEVLPWYSLIIQEEYIVSKRLFYFISDKEHDPLDYRRVLRILEDVFVIRPDNSFRNMIGENYAKYVYPVEVPTDITCRDCGSMMYLGKVIVNVLEDTPGLADCMKCIDCGHSYAI